MLASLGDDLKYVTITSAAAIEPAATLSVRVAPVDAPKCERCWHWRDDVGNDPARPELCGRCTDAADLCGGAIAPGGLSMATQAYRDAGPVARHRPRS